MIQDQAIKRQRILIAEDEENIIMQYKVILEKRGHKVTTAANGEECLDSYYEALKKLESKISGSKGTVANKDATPFDTVILDYRMPRKDGMEVAKEILAIKPHQRVIFASAYVKDTLIESIKELNQIVELMQKPFELDALVDTVEDKEIYEGLRMLNVNLKEIMSMNPTHEQIRDLLDGLRKIMKDRTF